MRELSSREIGRNLEHAKYQLKVSKGFRDWTINRCLAIKSKSIDAKEINICNLLIRYIQGLNWQDIVRQNKKYYEKGAI